MSAIDTEELTCEEKQAAAAVLLKEYYCSAEPCKEGQLPPVLDLQKILVDFFALDDPDRRWMALCNLAVRPIPYKFQRNADCLIEQVTEITYSPEGKVLCEIKCKIKTCYHDPDSCIEKTTGIDYNALAASASHTWSLDQLQGVQLDEHTIGVHEVQLDEPNGANHYDDEDGIPRCPEFFRWVPTQEQNPACDNGPSDDWVWGSPCGWDKKKASWMPWGEQNGRWVSGPIKIDDLCNINDDLGCGIEYKDSKIIWCESTLHGLGCNDNGTTRPGPGKNPIPVHGSESPVPHNKAYVNLQESLEFNPTTGAITLALDPCFYEHAPRGGVWPNGSLKTHVSPRYNQVACGAGIVDGLTMMPLPFPGAPVYSPYLRVLAINPSPCERAHLIAILHTCNIEERYFGGLLTSGTPGTQFTYTMEAEALSLGYPNDDRCFIQTDRFWLGHDGDVALSDQPMIATMLPGSINLIEWRIRGWVWNGTGSLGTWRPSVQVTYWKATVLR